MENKEGEGINKVHSKVSESKLYARLYTVGANATKDQSFILHFSLTAAVGRKISDRKTCSGNPALL
jgi:hypothetical protein